VEKLQHSEKLFQLSEPLASTYVLKGTIKVKLFHIQPQLSCETTTTCEIVWSVKGNQFLHFIPQRKETC